MHTYHISFFSNKPHCTTTMGTRVEKGQKSWFRVIIIHIYSGRYKTKKGGETSKSKILRILKRGISGAYPGGCLGVQTPPSVSRSLIIHCLTVSCVGHSKGPATVAKANK